MEYMDLFLQTPYTLRNIPRRFPATTAPSIVALVTKGPADWIRHSFDCVAFSFILEGSGEYSNGGAVLPVKAPCVFIEQPGYRYTYGPHQSWRELFFIYNIEQQPHLAASGLYHPDRHFWPILNEAAFHRTLRQLSETLDRLADPCMVDRADRLCELLIIESLQPSGVIPADPKGLAIRHIRDELLRDFTHEPDYDEIALRNGFSPAGFRRAWHKHFGDPPARFVMKHRINQACHLLAHSTLSIQEIAQQLSFHDALYFSRKFRQEIGMPPSAYRAFAVQPVSQRRQPT